MEEGCGQTGKVAESLPDVPMSSRRCPECCSVLGFFIMWNEEDKKYMRMAIDLALNGQGHVNPNPMVGAVIVRDGHVLSSGWHHVYGDLHAERDALSRCVGDPAGATMYVTLEPCCHHGKQPPCTDAIMAAGISRVVAGMGDPNPLVAGHGLEILRRAGIEVSCGLFQNRIRHINRVFVKYITTKRPWVVLKSAMTLDGRIAARTGDSKWVSGEESRRLVHELRGRYSGIVAGIGTAVADDPMLNCRLDGMRQPVRFIVDSRASLPLDSALVRTAGEYRTVVVHTADAPQQRLEALRSRGVELLECPSVGTAASPGMSRTSGPVLSSGPEQPSGTVLSSGLVHPSGHAVDAVTGGVDIHGKVDSPGKVDLSAMMDRIGAMGIDSLLVEGGAELNWSMVAGGLVDEYYIFLAPKIIGGRNAKGPVGGEGFARMAEAVPVKVDSVTPCGTDWLVHGFSSEYRYESQANEE